ncbi:C4-dicarboxylic acid transporter DauA [Kordia antarctica]|uniref:C4-dicarboxylic acid transporter DauA n=1 Tax=Kordia antarctica TaxID=1218801 RepID=A0A7L4ZMT0_9FLAO|nr:SulP family inorganic anion transporter [Kordia antarctica]QHI37516.1 C4-dicarboxylic acid transporter DauA [Kordia antarctica]
MSPKKNTFKDFLKALPKNIFSGFVVSLIALPLGLGLAMASEAPPISGIIAAVVGGFVVSILGGSYVTITGPGNGLVGVLLIAITALGINDAYGAIICSGALLLVLGFLRLGKLADFFPSSAIQGMLAAIGLIILAKSMHIMLGNDGFEGVPVSIGSFTLFEKGSVLALLFGIPKTIIGLFSYEDAGLTYAALAGIFSLIIMVFYPKIRNKYLQLVPAPMWIVIISIAFSYYYEMVLNLPNPIAASAMIPAIPSFNEVITDLPTISFSKVGQLGFWSSVFALTLISSIESLLSIKAVDKLDPEKRRSNVNKDLKALGLATIGSGFLGGLNVVTVIARSSVNVNNGGSNRSANFFHAFFLILFILLFSTQLTRIPLPALMAILVYTGYKLASPKLVNKMFSIGKEQLIIFFVTLLTTLKVGLITGIAVGVFTTFIIHIIINKRFSIFVRNLLKPNVLMFKEQDTSNDYFLSVKHFCSFLNYYKLKNKLDAIPEDKDVIVDFSMCEFVDHTVMENLNDYQEIFEKRGGHFEVIGLDMHGTDSKHPFALRRILPIPNLLSNLTRRQKTIEELAEDYCLSYESNKNKNIHFLEDFLFFRTKKINHTYNQLSDESSSVRLFDLEFSEGEFIAKEVVRTTMMYVELDHEIPEFTLDREGFLEKVYAFAGFQDIPIDNHTDFSKRFYLLGEDVQAIQTFFNDDLVHFFESNPYYHVESNGKALLIFGKERLANIKEIKVILDFGKRLEKVVQ